MMILVTRLQGEEVLINASQILWVESGADTIITFTNGVKIIVRESAQVVCGRIQNSLVQGPFPTHAPEITSSPDSLSS